MSNSKQICRWVFTYFISDEEVADLRLLNVDPLFGNTLPTGVKYILYQLEQCPDTARFHYQGYMVLERSQRVNWFKDLLERLFGHRKCHVEGAIRTHEECERYHSKVESRILGPWRLGDAKDLGQGRRSDLSAVQELLDNGGTMDEVRRSFFSQWVRYRQAFTEYANDIRVRRSAARFKPEDFVEQLLSFSETKAWLIYGRTNTGKTNFAMAHFKNPLLVRHLEDLGALDPNVHDGIVFDDVDFKHLFFTAIKNILDPDFDSSIQVRYQLVRIPAGMPRIFTHQHSDIFFPPSMSVLQVEAIERLFKTFEVKKDLRKIVLAYDSQPDNCNN